MPLFCESYYKGFKGYGGVIMGHKKGHPQRMPLYFIYKLGKCKESLRGREACPAIP